MTPNQTPDTLEQRLRKVNDQMEEDTLGARIDVLDEAADALAALRARTTPDRETIARTIHHHMRRVRDRGDYIVLPASKEAADAVLALFADPAPAPATEPNYVYGVQVGGGVGTVVTGITEDVARQAFERDPNRVTVVRSADGGATWEPAP
jgi:hypothetical protein